MQNSVTNWECAEAKYLNHSLYDIRPLSLSIRVDNLYNDI